MIVYLQYMALCKPKDLLPSFQGRLPLIGRLESLENAWIWARHALSLLLTHHTDPHPARLFSRRLSYNDEPAHLVAVLSFAEVWYIPITPLIVLELLLQVSRCLGFDSRLE